MVTQDKLNELLKEGEVIVTFTKKDGSTRTMVCTKNHLLIPSDMLHEQSDDPLHPKKQIKQNPNQVRVFDVEKQGWRSFNYSSVTEVELPGLTGVDPGTKALGGILAVAFVLYVLTLLS